MSAPRKGACQTWSLRRGAILHTTVALATLLPVVGGGQVYALSSTNATRTNASGTAPEVDLTFGSDIFPGFYLRIQRSPNGAKDGSDNYTTQTLNIVHSVTETERQALAIPNANLTADGYASPAGAYWQRYRWEREDGATGPWTEVTGTVTVSVNKYPTGASGVDRSQYQNVQSNQFSLIANNAVNADLMVRGITAMAGKTHFEVTIDGFYSAAAGAVLAGVCDSGAVTSFATFGNRPGASSRPGCQARVDKNGTNLTVYSAGGNVVYPLGVTVAVGDAIIVETDPTAKTVKFYFWDASANSGAGGLLNSGNPYATVTLSGAYIPAAFYAYAGGLQGTSGTPTTANSDSSTTNFGASAFKMTPTSGYSGW